MLSLLAVAMLLTFMTLVLSGRLATVVALIIVPVVFGLLGGFGLELAPMMLKGVQQLAPTGVMLAFAILYFCVMSDAGLFDPLITVVVRAVGTDPVRVVVGSGVLALLVSLDGDGSTTYIIVCSTMMPIYRRVGLNPAILACLLMLACSITNIAPWGGPTARMAAALHVEVHDVFVPLIPALLGGAVYVVAVAYMFGRRERTRLARLVARGAAPPPDEEALAHTLEDRHKETRRPKLLIFNLVLTAALLTALVSNVMPLLVLFMIASCIALIVNYPSLEAQTERMAAHAPSILRVIMVIFAAGVFVGILNGTGMSTALAQTVAGTIPPALGPYLAPITTLLSMPLTFFMDNNAFFFGVMPVLTEAAAPYGVPPVEMARAGLLYAAVHMLSPFTPSTYLLVALAGVDFGKHQRFTMPWAIILTLVMLTVAMLTGAVTLAR